MNQTIRNHFKKVDPILYSVIEKIDDLEPRSSTNYFSSLCESIISQQLSERVATIICERFKKLFPHEEITPEYVLKFSVEEIRAVGISRNKISFMKDLAMKVIDKTIRFDDLILLTNEEIIKELVVVKGIGPWTVEMFLIFTLGKEDVFSFGDLGLKRAIEKLYKIDHEPSKDEMQEISQKWSPYRSYACRVLWKSLTI